MIRAKGEPGINGYCSRSMAGEEQTVSAEAVRAELRRVLGSANFDASERNRRFLIHVVEEALAGRTERIKAYSDRDRRLRARRALRPAARLDRADRGRPPAPGARALLPDGRARRARCGSTSRAAATSRSSRCSGSRAPLQPAPRPASPRCSSPPSRRKATSRRFPSFTRGFTRSLIIALTRFTGLRVFGAETALRQPADSTSRPALARPVGRLPRDRPDLAPARPLRGRRPPRRGAHRPRGLGRDLRAPARSRPRSSRSATRWRTASRGRWRSPTARSRATGPATPTARRPRPSAATRRCCSSTPTGGPSTAQMIEAVRVGLERAVATEPDYAEAHRLPVARLLQRLPLPPSDRRARARPARPRPRARRPRGRARAELELGALRPRPRPLVHRQRRRRGLDALEAGRALNPNDTTILADLGQRYAMLARWDEAVPLLEESYATNPAQPGSYRIGLFLYHFAHGRFAEALAEARRVDAPAGPLRPRRRRRRRGRARPRRRGGGRRRGDPAPRPRLRRATSSPTSRAATVAPELSRSIVAGLAKAGLPTSRAAGARAAPVRCPARTDAPRRRPPQPAALEASATDFVVRLAFLGLFAWWSLELVRPVPADRDLGRPARGGALPGLRLARPRLGGRRGLAAALLTAIVARHRPRPGQRPRRQPQRVGPLARRRPAVRHASRSRRRPPASPTGP